MSPAQVYHFISEDETFVRRLTERLKNSREVMLASAFFTNQAFSTLKLSLEEALDGGTRITFLLGRFDFITEPKAVRRLLKLAEKHPGQIRVLFDADFDFHYKLALFRGGRTVAVIIGSSNLTPKGLSSVGEINLEIVGNQTVYAQARDLLQHRLKLAIPTDKHIDEYQRNFNRAKKYRQQRRRWEHAGRRRLTFKARTRSPQPQLDGEYVFCWIGDEIYDKILLDNIRKEYKKAQETDLKLPGRYVQFEKPSEGRLFRGRDIFFVRNDLAYHFGFARCVKKVRLLDENDREQLVIFYRYIRGLKATFSTKQRYESTLGRLGVKTSRTYIKSTTLKHLRKYFGSR